MARIDVKGLVKRRDALRDAAMEVRKLYKRVRTKTPHPDEGYHLNKLELAAFDFVIACIVGDDGAEYAGNEDNIDAWLRNVRHNPSAYAKSFAAVKKAPYAYIFLQSQREADALRDAPEHLRVKRRRVSSKR